MANTALYLNQQMHPSPSAKQITCRCLYSAEGHWGCADNPAVFLPDLWEQRSIVPFLCRTTLDSYLHILRGARISKIWLKDISSAWHQLPVYTLLCRKAHSP